MDEELHKLLSDGEEVVNMMQSRGWGIAAKKFEQKMLDLQMIGNLEGDTPEARDINRQARLMAVTIIFDVLNEMKGMRENHAIAKDAQKTDQNDTFIERV